MAKYKKRNKRVVAIVQARCNSYRLPNKVMKKFSGVPAIEILHKRLSFSKKLMILLLLLLKTK